MLQFSEETVSRFVLQHQHLTPSTKGKTRDDVLKIITDIGGLQFGAVLKSNHYWTLRNRMQLFEKHWLDYWLYEKRRLLEMHVLRQALRIVLVEDVPYFYQATRDVIKRRGWPALTDKLTSLHNRILRQFEKNQPLTSKELGMLFDAKTAVFWRTFEELVTMGKIVRVGRKGITPKYGLMDQFYPEVDLTSVDFDEAVRWVALKCLKVFGPFCTHDIAHWVGWTVGEAEKTVQQLEKQGRIIKVRVVGRKCPQWIRKEDVWELEKAESTKSGEFLTILGTDDELLLGCLPRLKTSFGYDWKYTVSPNLPILCDRGIIGEILNLKVEKKTKTLSMKEMRLKKTCDSPRVLALIRKGLEEFCRFHGVTLEPCFPIVWVH